MEDLGRSAWVGFSLKGFAGPLRVTLPDEDGVTIQILLNKILEKQKIIFVLPNKILYQPVSLDDNSDSEYLPDCLNLAINNAPVVKTHQKREYKPTDQPDTHPVKRQRSGLLQVVGGEREEREQLWLSATPSCIRTPDKDVPLEKEDDATIKVDVPQTEKGKDLTEAELADKAKGCKEV